MKITQVDAYYAKEHQADPNIYLVFIVDDGTAKHAHQSARMKPAKNCTLKEFSAAIKRPDYGFVIVDQEC